MTTKKPFTYTVLRYIHDVTTGEFVNVGVVVFSPEDGYLGALFRTTFRRVKSVFPTLHSDAFKASMRALDLSFKEKKSLIASGNTACKTALDVAVGILPRDDSSLQWSPVGSGIATDMEAKLRQLYARMVTCHDDSHAAHKKGEEDVWRHFSLELQQRHILDRFQPKTLSVADDAVEFKHAWKNGVWHCLAPVSFDLASSESIKDKAHKWLGKLSSVRETDEAFKLYFLVGEPNRADLGGALDSALRILRKSPFPCEIYRENQAGLLTENLASQIRQHDAQGSIPQ